MKNILKKTFHKKKAKKKVIKKKTIKKQVVKKKVIKNKKKINKIKSPKAYLKTTKVSSKNTESKADNLRYDFLKAQRVLIYNECIPLLKSTININPTRTKKELLYRVYSILEDTEANKIKRELVKSKDLFDESIDKYNKRKAKEFADDYMKENKIKVKDDLNDSNQFDLDSPDYTTVPKSGYSPYDRYFGKGVYNSTDNSVVVKASNSTHVVFILIDTYTGKRIRNEFIRKGH